MNVTRAGAGADSWTVRLTRSIQLRQNVVYAAFFVICVGFALLSPYFLTWQNAKIIAIEAAATAIVGCGLTFVIIAADIDLSVGSMYALAGTVAAYLMQLEWGWIPAVAATIAVGLILGVLNGLLTVKGGVPSFLVTLGTMGIARGLDLVISGTKAIPIYDQAFSQFFASNIASLPLPIWWAGLTALVSGLVLGRTVYGRHVYAVGGGRETSRLAGVNVGRIRLSNFLVSAFLATFAGLIVSGRIQAGQPTIGQGFELDVITAVILGGTDLFGGKGRIRGTLIGALIITVITNGLILLGVDANVQTIAKGVVLILTVLFRAKL